MKNRSELREAIMKIIYQVNLLEEAKLDYDLSELIKEQIEVQNDFANTCADGIIEHKKEIYDLANKYLNKWTMDRLNKVDQAILSLGIFELDYTDTPSVVAINEAIELSKKYSNDDIPKVINGILDSVLHNEEKINE